MKTAYQRLYRATELLRDEAGWACQPPETANCSCCGRPWDQVEEPGQAIPFQYGNPEFHRNHRRKKQFAIEWQCTTCQTLRIAAFAALGIERYASGVTPVGQRLSMLSGAGAVITARDTLHLAVKPGHWRKFSEGTLARQGQVHVGPPTQLLLQLDAEGLLGPIEDGIVLIENFGRQPEGLMDQLALTTSWIELWANSSDGPRLIEMQQLKDLYKVLEKHGQAEAATKHAFWRPVADAAAGRFSLTRVASWSEEDEGSEEIAANLPLDPHIRRRIHLELQILHDAWHGSGI